MRSTIKQILNWAARTTLVNSFVGHLVYPSIIRWLGGQIYSDNAASGIVLNIAWKTHAHIVLHEELRPTGIDCTDGILREDHNTRAKIINVVVEKAEKVQGDILEFGVYKGESLFDFAERCPHRQVYGFDSFEGLPEQWWTRPAGTFKTPKPVTDKANVKFIVGYFDRTLPRFLDEWTGTPAIIHVDCDLYSSTLCCLLALIQRLKVGTVILFDEYYNYSDFASHEWLAWREIIIKHQIIAPCIAYDGRRAAFQITELGNIPHST